MNRSQYEKIKSSEEKIFGYDSKTLEKITEAYCRRDHDHLPPSPLLSEKPFWDSLHEGCEKLAKEEDIIRMI